MAGSVFFKGAIPISFHAHVSDISPEIIVSTLAYLIGLSPNSSPGPTEVKNFLLTPTQIKKCGVAMLRGAYGANAGSLVRIAPLSLSLRLEVPSVKLDHVANSRCGS